MRIGNYIKPAPAAGSGLVDTLKFLRQLIRNPRGVAAIAPSSAALAELITRGVAPTGGPVLELGPGTGVFTDALIAKGVVESDITLVEFAPAFAGELRKRFPAAHVVTGDAGQLDAILPADGRSFGNIICGLGLRNMTENQIHAIVAGSFRRLAPGGAFDLFTYGLHCSVSPAVLQRLGLVAGRVGRVYWNLPPASVYRIMRWSDA